MAIVVDANLIAAAANREPAGAAVIDRLARRFESGEELHAPALLHYEVEAVWQGRSALGRRRTGDAAYIALAEDLGGRV